MTTSTELMEIVKENEIREYSHYTKSKAFDSVDHITMIVKLKNLNIADNIIQWVVAFLTDRNQLLKIGEKWSITKIVNRSIVQGSAIRPSLFIICIIDLKPIGSTNYITKYANDSSLLAFWYLKNKTIKCRLIWP